MGQETSTNTTRNIRHAHNQPTDHESNNNTGHKNTNKNNMRPHFTCSKMHMKINSGLPPETKTPIEANMEDEANMESEAGMEKEKRMENESRMDT